LFAVVRGPGLNNGNRLVNVHGPRGIGKTTFSKASSVLAIE
jgi:hypothetical protein